MSLSWSDFLYVFGGLGYLAGFCLTMAVMLDREDPDEDLMKNWREPVRWSAAFGVGVCWPLVLVLTALGYAWEMVSSSAVRFPPC